MTYSIDFFNVGVKAEVDEWPAGVNASFTRIAEQMIESGPNLGLPYTGLWVKGFSRFGPREKRE